MTVMSVRLSISLRMRCNVHSSTLKMTQHDPSKHQTMVYFYDTGSVSDYVAWSGRITSELQGLGRKRSR